MFKTSGWFSNDDDDSWVINSKIPSCLSIIPNLPPLECIIFQINRNLLNLTQACHTSESKPLVRVENHRIYMCVASLLAELFSVSIYSNRMSLSHFAYVLAWLMYVYDEILFSFKCSSNKAATDAVYKLSQVHPPSVLTQFRMFM